MLLGIIWLNDDDDQSEQDVDTTGSGNNQDVPGNTSSPNYSESTVQGTRDLVDFFPLYLNIGQLLQQFPPSNTTTYTLSQDVSALNFVYTNLTQATAFDYLRPPDDPLTNGFGDDGDGLCDQAPGNATKHQITSTGYVLSNDFLANITTDSSTSWGVVLIDGRRATQAPLLLTVTQNSTLVAQLRLDLRITAVETMYRHVDLRDGAEAPGGLVDVGFMRDTALPSNYQTMPQWFPDSVNSNDWIVFLPGSNVSGANTRGWESQTFKRLYWSHNRAKFVGVAWYGDPYDSSTDYLFNYQAAVRNAFTTAPVFANLVKSNFTGGNVTVIAHSAGSHPSLQCDGGLRPQRDPDLFSGCFLCP